MSYAITSKNPNKQPSVKVLTVLSLAALSLGLAPTVAPAAEPAGLHPALVEVGLTLEMSVDGAPSPLLALQRGTGTRQLRLVLTRAASTDQIGLALVKPLGHAAIEGSFVRCVLKLGQAFGKRSSFQRGDEIVFEHEADEPLRLRINQQLVSGALCEREFMPLLAGHWLGATATRVAASVPGGR